MFRVLKRAAKSAIRAGIDAHCRLDTAISGRLSRLEHYLRIPLYSREWLPILAAGLQLTGTGVEVGVFEGRFSEHILRLSKLSCLYSVDPWRAFAPEDYFDRANAEQAVLDQRFETARARLEKFGRRSVILRTTSKEAAQTFADASLDFVYIDANHSYLGCQEDLQCWWPKLRRGGLFAGDDFLDAVVHGTHYGVKPAVEEFCAKHQQELRLTHDFLAPGWPNWYLVKR